MKNIYILQGNYYRRKKALDDIKSSLGSFDLFICDNSCSYNYIQQKITEYSCFGVKNLIILNDWPFIDVSEEEALKSKNDMKKAGQKKIVKKFS